MKRLLRVLVIDDSENDVMILLRALRRGGFEPQCERVYTAATVKNALDRGGWEIVICDYHMPDFDGLAALKIVRETSAELPFILVSGMVGEETAVDAMKAGAQDYIMKRNLARLVPAVERELREAESRAARKRAEQALRQSEEQFRQAQKMEAVGRLAAGVAHDFNNILTAITGYSELGLRQIREQDPLRGNFEQIKRAADRAASLTQQLLAFSRKQPLKLQIVDLNLCVANVGKMLCRVIGEDVHLITTFDSAVGRVQADPSQLEQVLMNLAVNARDTMPKGGALTVSTANVLLDETQARHYPGAKAGPYVLLSVADTGTGMTEEVKARMFEPFFTTKEQGKGTGLGLATCYGIVQQSGGHIEVETELGRGTTFKIYLPRAHQTADATPRAAGVEELPTGDETVLIVDDESSVRHVLSLLLSDLGYSVLEASNGSEALRVAERPNDAKIDLLLSDLVMPVMNGKELVEQFRQRHPTTCVLVTSGYSDETLASQGLVLTDQPFLRKPFTSSTLARKIREALTP